VLTVFNCLCFNEFSIYSITHTNAITCKENSRTNRKSKGPRFLCFTYTYAYRNTENDKEVKGFIVTKSNSDFSSFVREEMT